MSESCECARWEGTEPHHTSSFPDALFETIEREDLGDYHGATPHRGRLRCKKCGSTFGYSSDLRSTMVTREIDVVRRVLAAMRAGKSAQVGGGRSFCTYEIRDTGPVMITCDDGYTEDVPISEERLIQAIESDRTLFLDYLRIWDRPS